MVYLHTPRVFHSLMVLSREPETIWRLSAEKATLKTSLVWPTNRRVVAPLGKTPNRAFYVIKTIIALKTHENCQQPHIGQVMLRVDDFSLCKAFTKQEKSFLFGKEDQRQNFKSLRNLSCAIHTLHKEMPVQSQMCTVY